MTSVTRRSQSTRALRRAELRQQLLVAIEAMLQAGESYTEMSVERIVAEAAISRSTFYVYFEDKGDLLESLTEELMGRLDGLAHSIWALPAEATIADVRQRMAALVATYREHQGLMSAVVDTSTHDERVRARFGGLLREASAGLSRHIHEGQAGGYVRPGLDAEPVAAWLVWMTERGMYSLVRHATDAESDRLIDALTAVVWNTLYEGVRNAPQPQQET